MKKQHLGLALIAFLAAGILGLHGAHAALKTMTIHKPWARATSPVAKAGGAFMILHNHGRETDHLIGADSAVAARTEVHQTKIENGVMMMKPVDGITIAPDKTVTLKPGSYHIMFMGLKHPLTEGSSFPLTLVFEKAGKITVQVPVKKAGAGMSMGNHSGNHDKDHDSMRNMHKSH